MTLPVFFQRMRGPLNTSRHAPILSQTCLRLNKEHTSREVKIFVGLQKTGQCAVAFIVRLQNFPAQTNRSPFCKIDELSGRLSACNLVIVN